ncbi:hypothetical protein FRC09_006835, partial [Ceratobasidium sp. 395]
TSSERNQLQRDLEAQRASAESEKKELEGVIADLSKVDNNVQAAHQSAQEDLRAQAALAQQANEKYERELLAHAEALKQINQLKSTISTLQGEVRKATSASDTAIAKLQSSEASWGRQKETMEKEASELTSRVQALQQQNTLLHNQLEDVNTQAAKIRQTASAAAESLAVDSGDADVDAKMQQLRDVIAFVRKEKEIVDLQLHLAQVDNTRIKSEIERLNASLDETRTTLLKERAQAAESSVSSTQHAELVDKINQLNILRESNSTLRAESEANRKRAERFQSQLLRLKTEQEPIKLELATVKAELEERQRQSEQFQSDIEQLKERFASHDRIDPGQLSETVAAKEAAEAESEKLRGAAKSWKERYDNFTARSREELIKRNTQIAQLEAEKNQVAETSRVTAAELEQLKNDLAKTFLQVELDTLRKEKEALEAKAGSSAEASNVASTADQEAWNKEKESLQKELEEAQKKQQASSYHPSPDAISNLYSAQTAEGRAAKILGDAKTFRRDKAKKKVQQLTAELATAKSSSEGEKAGPTNEELIAQHEVDKTAAVEKAIAETIEKLRAELASAKEASATITGEIAALKTSHEQELKKLAEEHATKLAAAEAKSAEGSAEPATAEALKAAREDGISAGKKELASKITLMERKVQAKDMSIATLSARNTELERLLQVANSSAPTLTAIPSPITDAKAAPKRTGSVSNGAPAAAAASSTSSTSEPALPGKPAAEGAGRGAAAARGARGAASVRGAAGRGRGRGGMTGGSVLDGVNAVLGAASTTPVSGGTSIAGAAKRPRESEGNTGGDGGGDLAKRLRSAEAANAPAKSNEAPASAAAAPTRTLPPRNRGPPPAAQ